MTRRDIERSIWAMLANDLTDQSTDTLMERAGWAPETVPPSVALQWSHAAAHVSQILSRRATVRHLTPRRLAGQMTIEEAAQ